MRQTINNLLVLCLILGLTTTLTAQRVECVRDFEVKTNVTQSTCMANGMIEVTLEGDLSALDMSRAEYGLEPAAGTSGTTLLPSGDNVLRGITPGTYTLSVRTFCKVGDQFGRVNELLNVKVGGSYKPLMADFDQTRSRKSYKECSTGLIAFNITSDTGYGDLKFYMTKAPQGVSLGEFFPVKGTLTGRYFPYTLSGVYPPGVYQIDIDDNCGKSTLNFTLGEITGLPSPTINYSNFRPISANLNCDKVLWQLTSPNPNTEPDYYRSFRDFLYEVALVPAGVTPAESDWVSWNSTSLTMTLPGVLNDYYATGSLTAFLRLKDCNEVISLPFSTNMKTPHMRNSYVYNCDYFSYGVLPWYDYDGMLCYPITASIITKDDNVVRHTEVLDVLGGTTYMLTSFQYLYKTDYLVEVVDNAGFKLSYNVKNTFAPSITLSSSIGYKCNTFTTSLMSSNSYYSCFPIDVDIYKLKEGGSASSPEDFVFFDNHTFTTAGSKAVEWEYGSYRMVATYHGHLLESGEPYKSTVTRNILPNKPTGYYLSIYNPNVCTEDYFALRVSSSTPTSNTYYPVGTTFTVIEAPAEYQYLNIPQTATSSFYYFTFPGRHTPAGRYKVEVNDGCGDPIFVEATLNGGYSARNTKFVVERDGCEGERLKLEGTVTNAGIDRPSSTYFQIISGPQGADKTLKAYGESVLLASDGEYVVGVRASSSSSCYLKRDTITFVKSKPTLNTSVTSSYVCTDRLVGYIIVAGQNGTEPYRFDLLDKDKVQTGAVPTDVGDGRFFFDYGSGGETYFVRITDACGNSNDQEIKLTDLETQRIVYNTPPSGEYCLGDDIKLNCITLGETSYLWRGPNGFVSTEQNPILSPATEAMTGYYSVSVMPEFCGETVTDQLYIKVFPDLVPGTVSSDQEICVGTRARAMNCVSAGGKGLHKYQWQSSTDRTNWGPILGADRATYTPPVFTKSGTHYYRLQITDDCKTVFSDAITLNVTACYIMVNPNIRSKVN